MEYTEKTYAFIEGLYEEDERLLPIKEYARQNNIPVMRETVSRFLQTAVTLKQPKRILELGTAIGYSGSVMLLSCGAHLTTVELSEESFFLAAENFKRLGLFERVTQAMGDANEQLQNIPGPFDLVFLDYAKAQYVRLLPFIVERLAPGGVLIADNVLFRGWIAGEEKRRRRFVTIVKRMREFLALIARHESLTTSILPFCDGVSVSVKKGE